MQAHSDTKHGNAAPETILHPASRRLFSYWTWLRGERSAPGRRDIDLRALAPILPWVGIMERRAGPKRHCWRLAGTGIARLWGNGLTGRPVAADWPDVHRQALLRALDGVCERRQPFVARIKVVSAKGDAVGLELFAAPVQADDASVQTLCTVAPFREPHWLGRIPLVDVDLSTLTAVGAAPLPGEITPLHSPASASKRLRLIQGGRSD